MRQLAAAVIAGLTLMRAADVFAQPASELISSVDVVEIHDTNLLFAPHDRETDAITRVTPAIAYVSRSPLFDFSGRYSLDAERFAEHQRLSAINAHRAALEMHYRPSRLLDVGVDAAFTDTHMPTELNSLIGFALSRARTTRFLVHPSGKRQIDRNTDLSIDYSLTDDRYAGIVHGRAQRAGVQIERRRSERDRVTVGYEVQRFDFESRQSVLPQMAYATNLHALTLGWAHDISRLVSVTLRGGPRLVDGRAAGEVGAAVKAAGKSADVSVGYTQTQTALVGIAGIADAQAVTASAGWHAWRSLQVTASSGVFRVERMGIEAYGYRAGFEAMHPLTKTLAVRTTYEANLQRGNIYAVSEPDLGIVSRHVVSIGLVRSTLNRER
jgi:hypothetical protein